MTIYKYMSSTHWKTILAETLIRFTPPASLNDPFEMQPVFKYFLKASEFKNGFNRLIKTGQLQSILEQAIELSNPQMQPEQRPEMVRRIEDEIRRNPDGIEAMSAVSD